MIPGLSIHFSPTGLEFPGLVPRNESVFFKVSQEILKISQAQEPMDSIDKTQATSTSLISFHCIYILVTAIVKDPVTSE